MTFLLKGLTLELEDHSIKVEVEKQKKNLETKTKIKVKANKTMNKENRVSLDELAQRNRIDIYEESTPKNLFIKLNRMLESAINLLEEESQQ